MIEMGSVTEVTRSGGSRKIRSYCLGRRLSVWGKKKVLERRVVGSTPL